MKYLGGKHGIGKLIAEYITQVCPYNTVDGYLEPFCGSLGVFKNMTDKQYKKYIASDMQPDLIELWKKIQNNNLEAFKKTDIIIDFSRPQSSIEILYAPFIHSKIFPIFSKKCKSTFSKTLQSIFILQSSYPFNSNVNPLSPSSPINSSEPII